MGIRHGIDIVRISRIKRGITRLGEAYLDRLWTAGEQAYCLQREAEGRYASFAVRFAAKEAVAKALGTGLMRDGISLTSIDVHVDTLGSPYVVLTGGAAKRFADIGGIDLAISLTHDGDFAQASCVILTEQIQSPGRRV